MGQLDSPLPEILERDDPTKAEWTSWEGIYLAAHRHRIDDLRKQALDKMLEHLGDCDAIAFLFRSAYLFEGLRGLVITQIANERHATIVNKETREKYVDHPECYELLGELFKAFHSIREN